MFQRGMTGALAAGTAFAMGDSQPEYQVDSGVGLCSCCEHEVLTRSAKGALFRRCGLALRDPRYPKYPRLPVWSCAGWKVRPRDDGETRAG
jgi:hypothetical protein